MLETLREYADEKLSPDQREYSKRVHADHYLSFAREAGKALTGPEQAQWLARLEVEHDNLRAALRWAIASGIADTSISLAIALGRFWLVRGHWTEGRRWFASVLAMERGADHMDRSDEMAHWATLRADALDAAGNL